MQRLHLALMVGLSLSCATRKQRRGRERICNKVAAAAEALENRADPAALDEAVTTLDFLGAAHPRHRCALEASARGHLIRAEGYPTRDPEDLEIARERGVACLRLRPGVNEAVRLAGGRLTPEAAGMVEVAELGCLQVSTRAWLRWLEARGTDGAALDLEPLRALVQREGELGPPGQDLHHLVDQALLWSLPGEAQGADRQRADAAFLAAAKMEPELLRIPVDRARHVLGPRGDTGAWKGTLRLVLAAEPDESDPFLMENLAAQAVARELVDGPPPRPDSPAP